MFKSLLVEFCRALREEIGELEYADVLALNASETDPNVCHSHDYCDSNMIMLKCVQRVYDIDASKALEVMLGDSNSNEITRTVCEVWHCFSTAGRK